MTFWIILAIVLCLLLPIVGFVLLRKKGVRVLKPFLIGAAAFFVSQIVLRIPLLNMLAGTFWYQALAQSPVAYGLFLGLTAGLVEELARFGAFALLLKDRRSYNEGIAFGLGHGGIEVLLITVLSFVNTLVLLFAYNNGTLAALAGDQLAATEAIVLSLTPGKIMLAVLERISAMGLHVSLSIMVLAGFERGRKLRYLVAAILLHALMDASIVIVPSFINISTLGIEIMLLLMSSLLVFWAVRAKKWFINPPIVEKTKHGEGEV
ncbi:YhfC family intramembrane metalloprotease [Eubacteriales bacterium OttesenSCG-928-K08]|nr:YhfC family intramembrane metalloprotease [Eubacteriales bacterium OttesenSCG-928-K08]